MTPDQPKVKARHLTPWRAAVLGAYVCLIVYGVANEVQQNGIDANSKRSITAICVEVNFLENSALVTRDLIDKNPNDPDTEVRRQSLERVEELIVKLRRTVPGCPPLKR